MAIYDIKIINTDGSSVSQPIGSTSEHVLMQGSTINLTSKISSMEQIMTTLRTDVDAKATKSVATTSVNGLMSAADKSKLDGIAAQANKYTLPAASASTLGGVKVSTGIAVSGDGTITNSGVRAVSTGTTNGSITVNTNGSSAQVAVKGLGTAAYTTSRDVTSASSLTIATYGAQTPTINTIGYWNGRYDASNSNLAYCNKGAFGTIVTKATTDYLASTGGQVSGTLTVTGAVQMNSNLNVTGNITGAKVYGAVWNDYAEWFEKKNSADEFEPGDILAWNDNGVVKANQFNAGSVVGVYSNSYGHILGGEDLENMEDNHAKFVPVGLVGRLDVKVTGRVSCGDLITVSNIDGIGKAVSRAESVPGTIIGKALENKETNEVGKIKIMIMLA